MEGELGEMQKNLLKGKYIQQIYMTTLSECAQLRFEYSLTKKQLFYDSDILTTSTNQSMTIQRFNTFSKGLNTEIGQLMQTHSPVTYTIVTGIEDGMVQVLHLIYIPIMCTKVPSESNYYLVAIVMELPVPKNVSYDTHDELSAIIQSKESDEKQQGDVSGNSEMTETQKRRKEKYEIQLDCMNKMKKFEDVKGMSMYTRLFELLTDTVNLMFYKATLIIFKHINVQMYNIALAKKQCLLYMFDTIRNFTEGFTVAVDTMIDPTPPVYDQLTLPGKAKKSSRKTTETPFTPQFLSMVISAHMETHFTFVLAQTDQAKNFLYSLFTNMNPPQFSTTINTPFTCFPYFIPRRNAFIQTMFLAELEHSSLYDIPLPYCIINCKTMQVAVSKSSSIFEHFAYRASAHIAMAAKTLQFQFPVLSIPAERSIRLLQRCPTTEGVAARVLTHYCSGEYKLCYLVVKSFLEFYEQRALIVQSVMRASGDSGDVLSVLEDLFECHEADGLMLTISFLKGDASKAALLYSMMERRLRID